MPVQEKAEEINSGVMDAMRIARSAILLQPKVMVIASGFVTQGP